MKILKILLSCLCLFLFSACGKSQSPDDVVFKYRTLIIEVCNEPSSEELYAEYQQAIQDAISNYANLDQSDEHAIFRSLYPKSIAKYGSRVRELMCDGGEELSEDMVGFMSMTLMYASTIAKYAGEDEDLFMPARCEVVNSAILADGKTAVVKSIQYDADDTVQDDAHFDILTLVDGVWKLDFSLSDEDCPEIIAEYEQIVSAQ